MSNPLRGIYLNNRFYNYVSDSFREAMPLKNLGTDTNTSKTFAIRGAAPSTYTLTLNLDSTYRTRDGNAESIGYTTWLGTSRLHDLKTFTGALGSSLPVIFVTPYGVTTNVIPTGGLDIAIFNPSNPSATSGVEFRVTLTLEQTSN